MLIADHLAVSLSIRGVWELLRRRGWSCQQPGRRAVERDEAAVASWVKCPGQSHRCGARGMANLRGRSCRLDDVAPRMHLGTHRQHARGSVQRRFPRRHLHGRAGVLQGR
ncbi:MULTISPECIES: winged helix-turn-helix domain-containing protein [unclassified Streptomyces]|uniref:helix-turn-helix domain-containing protein n=1 Tax=unclassified Streptomyces TaxID=2593676 RepID=UPI0029C003C7|nr:MULTISPECIES: winged helix-turn-helix domain-containing protein [unclassified Streptomyces]